VSFVEVYLALAETVGLLSVKAHPATILELPSSIQFFPYSDFLLQTLKSSFELHYDFSITDVGVAAIS